MRKIPYDKLLFAYIVIIFVGSTGAWVLGVPAPGAWFQLILMMPFLLLWGLTNNQSAKQKITEDRWYIRAEVKKEIARQLKEKK